MIVLCDTTVVGLVELPELLRSFQNLAFHILHGR